MVQRRIGSLLSTQPSPKNRHDRQRWGINFGLDKLTEYDQTDGHIVWAGGHTPYTSAPSLTAPTSADRHRLAATIYFTGTGSDMDRHQRDHRRRGKVSVEAARRRSNVNLAASAASYQVECGTRVPVERSPQPSRSSGCDQGKYVTIDAVKVDGVIAYAHPMISRGAPTSAPLSRHERGHHRAEFHQCYRR